MVLADLEDLKTFLNIPANRTTDDDELQFQLDAATEVVQGIVGDLSSAIASDSYPVHNGTVLLNRRPVGPVSITGPTGTAVTGFTTRTAARLLTGVEAHGYVTVTYPVGGGDVPASVRLATCIIAGHLWETQRGTAPTQLQLQQPDAADDLRFADGKGYAIPNRAKELLAPWADTGSQVA